MFSESCAYIYEASQHSSSGNSRTAVTVFVVARGTHKPPGRAYCCMCVASPYQTCCRGVRGAYMLFRHLTASHSCQPPAGPTSFFFCASLTAATNTGLAYAVISDSLMLQAEANYRYRRSTQRPEVLVCLVGYVSTPSDNSGHHVHGGARGMQGAFSCSMLSKASTQGGMLLSLTPHQVLLLTDVIQFNVHNP